MPNPKDLNLATIQTQGNVGLTSMLDAKYLESTITML